MTAVQTVLVAIIGRANPVTSNVSKTVVASIDTYARRITSPRIQMVKETRERNLARGLRGLGKEIILRLQLLEVALLGWKRRKTGPIDSRFLHPALRPFSL